MVAIASNQCRSEVVGGPFDGAVVSVPHRPADGVEWELLGQRYVYSHADNSWKHSRKISAVTLAEGVAFLAYVVFACGGVAGCICMLKWLLG